MLFGRNGDVMKNFTPTALKWTRSEIDDEWKILSDAISEYLENNHQDQVEAIEEHLGKMGRFFQMIGAGSAYLLVREMGSLFRHLVAGNVTSKDEAHANFAQSCLQLPYILDYLATGAPDIPELMLPLLNELRKLTNEKKLRRIDVFCADHSLPFSVNASSREPVDVQNVVINLRSWREHSIGDLTEIGNSLQQLAHQNLFSATQWTVWIMGLMCHAIKEQKLDYHVNIQFLFARLEKELSAAKNWKHYRLPPDLLSQVLYYSVYDASGFKPLKDISNTFGLQVFSSEEKLKAQSILAGKNAELLSTVCKTVKDELSGVKDSLDLFLRTQDITRLNTQVQILQQSSDTLRMVGLNDIANSVLKQSTVVMAISNGISAGIDENLVRKQLLDIAYQLLMVDDLMDQHVTAFSPAAQHTGELFNTLNREISISIAKVRNGMLDSQKATNNEQKNNKISEMVSTLETIDGAFFAMGLTNLNPYIKSLKFFLENEYRVQLDKTSLEKIQAWADVVVAVEYYIEAEQDFLPTLDDILKFATASVLIFEPNFKSAGDSSAIVIKEETVCYQEDLHQENDVEHTVVQEILWEKTNKEFVSDIETLSSDITASNSSEISIHLNNLNSIENNQGANYDELVAQILQEADQVAQNIEVFEQSEGLLVHSSTQTNNLKAINEQQIEVFDGASSDAISDPHIKEIFAEELQEEILGLKEWLPMLARNPNDRDTLYNVRKSFHSIKGSGRMVGAITLATMSWVIESTLNQVMDNKRPLSSTIVELIENGLEMFEKHYQVLNGNPQTWNYDQLSRWFDLVEDGSDLHLSDLNIAIENNNKETVLIEEETAQTNSMVFASDFLSIPPEETIVFEKAIDQEDVPPEKEDVSLKTTVDVFGDEQLITQKDSEVKTFDTPVSVNAQNLNELNNEAFASDFNQANEFIPLPEPSFADHPKSSIEQLMLSHPMTADNHTADTSHSIFEPKVENSTATEKSGFVSTFPAYTEWSLEPMEKESGSTHENTFVSISLFNDEQIDAENSQNASKEDQKEDHPQKVLLSAMEQVVEQAAQNAISPGDSATNAAQELSEISDLDLPDLSAAYMGRQTDWKIHLGYLYSLQEQIAQVGMELALINTLSVADKIVLQKYFEDLSKRQKEGLHELRRTTIENERNLIKARSEREMVKTVQPIQQKSPVQQSSSHRKTSRNDNPQRGYTEPLTFENDMNVFTSEKLSFWKRIKKMFAKK